MSVITLGSICVINDYIEEDLNIVEQDDGYLQSLSILITPCRNY